MMAAPPRIAEKLLSWYCKPELLEDLQGDLNEFFQRNVREKGLSRARLIFFADVFKFCRPYTLRKFRLLPSLSPTPMLSSYIKTSGRNILRNKLFSAINIVGLAISLSVGLLMIGMLSDLYSYDKFNANYEKIYRIKSRYTYQNHPDQSFYATTSLKAGLDVINMVPNPRDVVMMRTGIERDVKCGTKTVQLEGYYSNENIFQVFSYPVIKGNATLALKEPFTAIVTVSAAKKLFGDDDAIGKTIVLKDGREYMITGLVKDLPKFSHMHFDFLVSISSLDQLKPANLNQLKWADMWDTYVYFVMPDHTSAAAFQASLDRIAREENKPLKEEAVDLGFLAMKDIALGEELNNSWWQVMPTSYVWMLVVLSAVVILSACFNYTNLSVARSLRRSREVGIRKVIGAGKNNVLLQFITESVVISMLALALAFALFMLLKPFFLAVNENFSKMLTLELSPRVIFGFIALGIFTGLSAGIFPAIFFTRVNAVAVLKGSGSVKGFRHQAIRKVLIVAQYTLSLMLISATVIGHRQYNYFLNFDLGFTTENVVNVNLYDVKPDGLLKEFSELPEVKGISKSAMITSVGNYFGTTFKNPEKNISGGVYYNSVDENYLPLHGHKLLAGRNFDVKPSANNDEVIVDEQTLRYFEIGNKDPEKALDVIVLVDNAPARIIGVMRNYQYARVDGTGDARTILRYSTGNPSSGVKDFVPISYLNVKISTVDWPSLRNKLETIWKKYDDVHPLNAVFYSDQIERAYAEIASMLKIIGFLSFLAIVIASLGMLGMIVLTTETRLKEISIRKVLGATEGNLIFILSKSFLMLLLIATVIGIPSAAFFFEKIILEYRQNRAPFHIEDLLFVVLGVFALALSMIISQTLKAARENPAQILKNE